MTHEAPAAVDARRRCRRAGRLGAEEIGLQPAEKRRQVQIAPEQMRQRLRQRRRRRSGRSDGGDGRRWRGGGVGGGDGRRVGRRQHEVPQSGAGQREKSSQEERWRCRRCCGWCRSRRRRRWQAQSLRSVLITRTEGWRHGSRSGVSGHGGRRRQPSPARCHGRLHRRRRILPLRALEMIIAVALPVLMIVLLTLPPILLSRWCCRLHGRRHGQRPHMRSARWRRLLLRRHQRRRGRKRRRGRMRRRGGVRQRQLLPKRRVA